MRREEWRRQCDEATRAEIWSLYGPNRIVKVVPALPTGVGNKPLPKASGFRLSGYITVAKAIGGLTPEQIEGALGLEPRSLASGAIIYSFSRIPNITDYSYEETADLPDGLAYTFMSDPRFPAGSGKIQQWRVREDRPVPITAGAEVRLKPGERFPG